MEDPAQHLLKEVFHQSVSDQEGIILIYIPNLLIERDVPSPIHWRLLLPTISKFDTRVFEYQSQNKSFVQLLASSKGLLHEIFSVHLKEKTSYRPITLVCHGIGGLLAKEAIASVDDDLNQWQSRLNYIFCIVFLRTPHLGTFPDTNQWSDQLRNLLAASPESAGKSIQPGELSQLHLSAAIFVRTFQQIEHQVKILSGFERPPPKSSIFKRGSSRATVDKARARIGIDEESLAVMDLEAHQILKHDSDSMFRRLIAQYIEQSMLSYKLWILSRENSSLTQAVNTPRSSLADTRSSFIETPSSISAHVAGFEFLNIKKPPDSVSQPQQRSIKLPLIFPRNLMHQKLMHYHPRPEFSTVMDKALLPSQQPSPMLNLLTFIITGLGGMGKTELARDFANRNLSQFDVIMFVVADQRQRLAQSYSEIARSLDLVEPGSTADPESDRERLKLWFENPVKSANEITEAPVRQIGGNEDKAKWLLILDNADDPQLLSDYWPVSGYGSVLVTSRDPSTSIQHYPFSEDLALQGFKTEDAVELLKTLTKNTSNGGEIDNAAKQIVQRLEGLPLAIDQISSIITRRRFSISDFARDYAQASDYHQLYDERHVRGGYEHSLGSVWAFESLEADEKGAFSLLCVLAMLDSTCIQEEIIVRSLSHGAMGSYPKVRSAYNNFLAILMERSMVQRDRDDKSLTLHRLVQDVARARIANRGKTFKEAFEIAWKSVAASFPGRGEGMNTAGSVERWQQCGNVYTHVIKLCQVVRELQDIQRDLTFPLELIDLLYEAAWWQCERREAAEALPLAELASTMCDLLAPKEETLQKTRTPLQRCQTKIWACRIVIAQSTGDSKNAFHYSQLRYKSAEDEFEATGVLTGFLTSTCNTLGISYAMNRLHEKALHYLTKSVDLRKQMPDFQKDWLYSPYYHMGITYHRMGDYEKAADIIQEAIDDREAALGPNDRISSRTAALIYSLGNVRNSEGRLDDAFGLHNRAYMQSRQTAGEFAFATLKCSQKLAEHYERFGCDSEARRFAQCILDHCGERADRKRDAAQAAFTLSRVLQRQGEIEKSGACRDKALRLHNELRPDSLRTSDSLTSDDIGHLIVYDYF